MEYRILGRTGLKVSVLGFGAASLGSPAKEVNKETSIRTVQVSHEAGINYFDVSPYYGSTRAETLLGLGLKHIPRSSYILATKAGRYGDDDFDFSPARIRQSLKESMQRLATDYIDVLQLHDIEFTDLEYVMHESIPVLQRLKEEGVIRFFGISGYPLKIFKVTRDVAGIDTMLSYCHYNLQNTKLMEFFPTKQESGVGIINGSPLGMGLLTEQGPFPWHPADEEIKRCCREAASFCREQGFDIAELSLQFAVGQTEIPLTLVGSAKPDEMLNNVECIKHEPDPGMITALQRILHPVLNKSWIKGLPENND